MKPRFYNTDGSITYDDPEEDWKSANELAAFCFVGSFQPYMDPPEVENWLSRRNLANDNDGDGIWVLDNLVLPPGSYNVTVVDLIHHQTTTKPDGGGGGGGILTALATQGFEITGTGTLTVTMLFDPRDKVVDVSVNSIPILCGNFLMATSSGSGGGGITPPSPPPQKTLLRLCAQQTGTTTLQACKYIIPPRY